MMMLLGAMTMAQTRSVQEPRSRIGPLVVPVAPGQNGTSLRDTGTGGGFTAIGEPSAGAETALPPGNSGGIPTTEMLIGAGDLLEISVYGAPDYIKQVRVSATGEITVPLSGTVKVGGLTTSQAETLIAKKLSDGKFFNDPKVSVLEKEFATQGISVLGEVQKPGIYPLPGTRSLYDALSAAGGTTARAGNIVSLTHRNDPQNRTVVTLSYDGKTSDQANVPVYPGDTVVVSKAGVVYVTGDVHLPGGFIMENAHMTVLQAVAMAQGANPTAALDGARLIRNSGQGSKPEEISIPLKKILSAKAPDQNLQPNDIVFVPSSAAKSAGRRTLDAIVQAATGMAIYGKVP
jgi:polysaccharide export outer membrane protein